jgi:hypothetical protein
MAGPLHLFSCKKFPHFLKTIKDHLPKSVSAYSLTAYFFSAPFFGGSPKTLMSGTTPRRVQSSHTLAHSFLLVFNAEVQ